MADNTLLNSGTGGDTIRDIDRGSGVKTQTVQLDFGGGTLLPENLASLSNPLPVTAYTQEDLLRAMLVELRIMNTLLMDGLLAGRLGHSLDMLREDAEEDISLN